MIFQHPFVAFIQKEVVAAAPEVPARTPPGKRVDAGEEGEQKEMAEK